MKIPFVHPKAPASRSTHDQEVTPESTATFISRYMTFGWVWPLLKIGSSRPLEFSDIWQLDERRRTSTFSGTFHEIFYKQFPEKYRPPYLRGGNESPDESPSEKRSGQIDTNGGPTKQNGEIHAVVDPGNSKPVSLQGDEQLWTTASQYPHPKTDQNSSFASLQQKTSDLAHGPPLPTSDAIPHPLDELKVKHPARKLYWALFCTIKKEILLSVLGWGFFNLGMVYSALLTQSFIDWLVDIHAWLATPEAERIGSNPGIGKGLGLIFGLYALLQVGYFGDCIESMYCFEAGWIVRSALWDAVSYKSLRLSPSARQEFSHGRLTTSLAADSSLVEGYCHFMANTVVDPAALISGFGILIHLMGYSALAGMAFMVLAVPLIAVILQKMIKAREQQLEVMDRRVAVMTEALSSIRGVKLYGFEGLFSRRIRGLREGELLPLRTSVVYWGLLTAISNALPVGASILTFVTYSLSGHNLSIGKVFASFQIYQVLQHPISNLPATVSAMVNARTACHRLTRLLLADETSYAPELDVDASDAVTIRGSFTFESSSRNDEAVKMDRGRDLAFELADLDLSIPRGKLVCVIGRVGSGKSALAQALIGMMRPTTGKVTVSGTVGFYQQNPWVQSSSIRSNILFNSPEDEDRLRDTIRACNLERDLQAFHDGVDTEVGEHGVMLSGGQQARIALGRVVYSNPDIVLLDDPLAAVDAEVAKNLINGCICGALDGKTRIVITHHLDLLPQADLILVMQNGRLAQRGSFTDLRNQPGIFLELMKEFGAESTKDGSASTGDAENRDSDKHATAELTLKGDQTALGVMEEEDRATGGVQLEVYKIFLKFSGSPWRCLAVLIWLILGELFIVAISLVLGWWTESSFREFSNNDYLLLYGCLGLAQTLVICIAVPLMGITGLTASRNMFMKAINGILHSPVSWFDRQPVGRIVSRLSKDQEEVDNTLLQSLYQFIQPSLDMLGTVGIIFYVFPYLGIIFLPFLVLLWLVTMWYKRTSVETKRLDSLARSFVYSAFTEQLTGMASIRAHGQQDIFRQTLCEKADKEMRVTSVGLATNRWLQIRLNSMANVVVLGVGLFGVGFKGTVSPALLGVALTFSISGLGSMSRLVENFISLEQTMNNVERLVRYTKLKPEAAPLLESDPPRIWPQRGAVEFMDVQMRYRPELPLILKGISFTVSPGEKIGIVGRTGAGKSSILQVLLRLVELSAGKIVVDGVDIATVGLETLRHQLSCIPQDPLLFQGTIRDNLDPFGERTDADLHEVLHKCRLIAPSDATSHECNRLDKFKLDATVDSGGSNFSGGERQLVALARAIAKDSVVIMLDEATASVDPETDATIQKAIRTNFKHHSILCIAHRLATVAFYDKVLVLDQGQVKEFAPPLELYDQPASVFRSMCNAAGLDRDGICRIREDLEA